MQGHDAFLSVFCRRRPRGRFGFYSVGSWALLLGFFGLLRDFAARQVMEWDRSWSLLYLYMVVLYGCFVYRVIASRRR